MRIQHNITAMSAYRNYTNNNSALAKNLEKLSSGYKINRAGDDAAGLAISEKMRAQISGLEQAQSNAKDGISLIQTAEGGLAEVHDMLNRMVTLAEQSANGTYDNNVDRAQLQKELSQLRTEINRIADSSNYNGINLLDGSMEVGKSLASTGTGKLPAVGALLGANTVLHQDRTNSGSTGTTFSVDFHNTVFSNEKGTEMTITLGGTNTITLKGDGTGELDGGGIINKLLANDASYVSGLNANGTLSINGQEFALTKGSGGDNRLTFTQVKAPTTQAEEVSGKMSVAMTGVTGQAVAVNAPSLQGTALITMADPTDPEAPTVDFTGLDQQAVADAMKALEDANSTSLDNAKVAMKVDPDNNKVTLVAVDAEDNETVISTAELKVDDYPDAGQSVSVNFKDAAGNDLGSVVLTAGTATLKDVVTKGEKYLTDPAVRSGLTYNNGESVQVTGSESAMGYVTNVGNATTQASYTFDIGDITVNKACTLTFTIGGKSFDVEITQAMFDADATDGELALSEITEDENGNNPIAASLAEQLNEVFEDETGGKFAASVGDTAATAAEITLKAANKAELTEKNLLGLAYTVTGKNTGAATGVSAYADYNVSTTDISDYTVDGNSSRLASTYFNLTASMVANGSTMQIGSETYSFTTSESQRGVANTVYTGDLDSSASDYLSQVAKRLTETAANNKTYTVGHDGSRMSFTEIQDQATYRDSEGKSTLTTLENIEKSFAFTPATAFATGLTLQIGDTADSYNQLTVSIKDCHASAMGIGDIDISTQDGATAAMNSIKNAINYVSDVRGTLGATQNRLDHTINNLSVMEENIQDAESTIRDTDIAEEMMEYTKNNILVQSAQAMLAQANQLPQGVLQLLQ